MQTLSMALDQLREKGAWFARARELRLLVIRASPGSRREVLGVAAGLESSHGMVVVITPAGRAAEIEEEMAALLEAPSLAGCRFVLVIDTAVPLLTRLMRKMNDSAVACDCRVDPDPVVRLVSRAERHLPIVDPERIRWKADVVAKGRR
jgi:hypothetical protein